MTHDLFGKLRYKPAAEAWVGYAPLARFAAHGTLAPRAPVTEADALRMAQELGRAVDALKERIKEQHGATAREMSDRLDAAAAEAQAEPADDAPDPREEERERKRGRREKRRADRLAAGSFPIRVTGPEEDAPSSAQVASFRHLLDNEPAVLDAVLGQVWESFRAFYADARWRAAKQLGPAASAEDLTGRFCARRVEAVREARGGFAHLVFTLDSDWHDDHGLVVVYSPDRREANWSSLDIVHDLLESDESDADEEYQPTPHDELVTALCNGDEGRARDLVAAGADVNAVDPDGLPPLCVAVDQLEVDTVRRLLAFGADPNLADPDNPKRTPLRTARKMYKEMGFAPAKKTNPLLDEMMAMMREAAGKTFDEMQARLDAIIGMLEAAGAS